MLQTHLKVFIDSDGLKGLEILCEHVGGQTNTLVGVGSSNVLRRPWCAGKVETASCKVRKRC